MARGWESKDVESRLEEALNKDRTAPPSQQEIDNRAQLHSLELDRTRLERDLANAKHPRHIDMVRAALDHVLAEIKLITPVQR